MRAGLCAIFFVSGVAALIFETLWFHQAGLTLGNSVWASSLVLAAFMGGLGVGNGVAGRVGARLRNPLRVYAALEALVAITGVALVALLPRITPALAPILHVVQEDLVALNAVRVLTGFLLMVVPSAAMGATLPIVVTSLYRRDPRFGAVLGSLYGWNTLGALVGALAGDALLIEILGIRGTALFAGLLNALAATLALALSRRDVPRADTDPGLAGRPGRRLTSGALLLLGAAFVSGGALLALEVVWFRFLLLSVSGTNLAFAVMLAVVLAGIGLGGLLGARWLSRSPRAHDHAASVALSAGVACVSTYAAFDLLLRMSGISMARTASETFIAAAPLMLVPCLLSGLLFTLLGQALQEAAPNAARSAGLLTLANTLGAMLGSLTAGFYLLPAIGIERSVAWLAATYAVAAASIVAARGRARRPLRARWAPAFCGAILAASLVFFPRGFLASRTVARITDRFPQWEPVLVREALTETLIYLRRDLFGEPYSWRLITNSHSMSSTATRDQRYMSLFVYLPIALRPETTSALLISYGVGVTANALTESAGLETIDVVDISADILETNRILYTPPRADARTYPLDDPRVRIHVEDGRHFLQTTERRFDLITGEPPPPKLAGIVSLYTQEYFELVHDRLTPSGLASYWLPVTGLFEPEAKAIIAAFCRAFPDCTLWSGAGMDWVLLGSRSPLEPVTRTRLGRQWSDPRVALSLREVGFESPVQLGALFLADAEQLRAIVGDVAPLIDDHPKRLSNAIPRAQPVFREWMRTETARRRFSESAWIGRTWPSEIRDETVAAFADQALIDRTLFREDADPLATLPELHRLLTETRLRTLPIWMLGSDEAAVRAAKTAAAAGRAGLGIDYQLAVEALADRDFGRAADLFGRARVRRLAIDNAELIHYQIYSLALAGRMDEARRLARGRGIEPAFHAFMASRFAWPPRDVVPSPAS